MNKKYTFAGFIRIMPHPHKASFLVQLFILIELYCIISGKVYKFAETSFCNHLEMESAENETLADFNPDTCQYREIAKKTAMYGLFFKTVMWGNVNFVVMGTNLICSPGDGASAFVVSVTRKYAVCMAYATHTRTRCHFKCTCSGNDVCSHVLVLMPGADSGSICEIKIV